VKQIITQRDAHGEYKFLCESPIERWRAETLFTKEPGTVDWLRATLKPGDCFYDIGANVGCYTLLAARLVGLDGHVIAFEPHPASMRTLMGNVELNLLSNVTLCALPLSNESDMEWLDLSALEAGSSNHQLGKGRMRIITYAAALDDLIALKKLRPPDVVKMDVDGHEPAILFGMLGTLEHVRSIQIEAQPNTAETILARLIGWHCYRHDTDLGGQKIAAGRPKHQVAHNLVFTRAA
jgi:FkbM family methyltransferase